MRKIKFRAWNKEVNSFFSWDISMGFQGSDAVWGPVEQFTGLKDKNGVEIYEGDIVHADYSEWHWNATVEWDTINPCFMMNKIGGNPSWEYDFNKCDQMELEVIGNIHQNTELMK